MAAFLKLRIVLSGNGFYVFIFFGYYIFIGFFRVLGARFGVFSL